MILNQRLRSLRVNNKFTQQDIANVLGVLPTTFQKFEHGTARPKLENIVKLADFFNVSVDYLLGRSNTPTRLP